MRSTHGRCRTAVARSTSTSRRLSAARFAEPNPLRALIGHEAHPKTTLHPVKVDLGDGACLEDEKVEHAVATEG